MTPLARFLLPAVLAVSMHAAGTPPNLLLIFVDNVGYGDLGCYGNRDVLTPNMDRLAAEGVRCLDFTIASPSCTPSRGALLAGQHFWRLREGANLWSRWPTNFAAYPDLLAKAGYHVGLKGKGWGPGDVNFYGHPRNPAGPSVKDFGAFLTNKPAGKPFCFWFGSTDPHRLYERGTGVKSGLKIEDVVMPPYLPDAPEVRSDVLDYYFEIERFDRDIGAMLKLLEDRGELDNTLVVITSDNGWPFPRGKATCYDAGTRMPLAIRWPAKVEGGRVVDDFVSHTDLAPTILEVAGLKPPVEMTGKSLVSLLTSGRSGLVETSRDKIFFGRERHASVRAGNVCYPTRGIRNADFLLLRNYEPERWPAGDPPVYGDVDQHLDIAGSPTKQAVVEHGDKPGRKRLFDLAIGKRPAEELYDLKADPQEAHDLLRDQPELAAQLETELDRYFEALARCEMPSHPHPKQQMTAEQLELLKGLGYLDDDAPRP